MSSMKKGVKTLNLGHNDIIGKVSFGDGCIINPSCSIICQDKTKQLIFGDYNIIEQKAIILIRKDNKFKDNKIKIGSYNIFGISSYISDCTIGDCNTIEPKVELKEVTLGNNNLIGAEVKVVRNQFRDNLRFFYPGKFKLVEQIDQQKHKQMIRSMYNALTQR